MGQQAAVVLLVPNVITVRLTSEHQNLPKLCTQTQAIMTTFNSMQPKTCSRLGQLAGSPLRQPHRLCCSASRRSLAVRASGDGSRVDRYDKHSIIVSPSILSADFAKLGEQVLGVKTAQHYSKLSSTSGLLCFSPRLYFSGQRSSACASSRLCKVLLEPELAE